jgi:hypothetical protein
MEHGIFNISEEKFKSFVERINSDSFLGKPDISKTELIIPYQLFQIEERFRKIDETL